MPHATPLITTIVAGLVLAFIFGTIANRFRMPPLVGYLFAGMLVGPYTPGFVADQDLASELAELGVILLMFGVGLHFSLKDLMSVRALAIPGAVAQMAVATALGLGLGLLMGWDVGGSLVFGIALSVASTVVLLKALQERRILETEKGRIAVGWLIVEDLAMVLALVLVPAFASLSGNTAAGLYDPFVNFVERVFQVEVGIWGILALTVLKIAAFVGFMLVVGRRVIPWALHATAHTGSRELFRLAVLAIALGVALGSAELFGVSLALGAFFAGMILSESELSHRAAQETLPLRDAFAVLFFVSVGMLFDPSIILTDPLPVLATVFIIVIGKSIAAFGIVVLFGRPVSTALTISASLAQIGEFSFILASMGVALAIMPSEGQDLILAGALISIILNPLVFFILDQIRPRLETRLARRRGEEPFDGPLTAGPIEPQMDAMSGAIATPVQADIAGAIEDDADTHPTGKTGHTILVGFGRVGSVVGEGLHATNEALVVLEDADHAIKAARDMGIEVITGNAASARVLELANLKGAARLIIAIPNAFEAGQVTEQSRKLNPGVRIIARAHSEEEEAYLANLGADTVILGEREIGLGMLAWVRGNRSLDPSPGPAAGIPIAAEPVVASIVPVVAAAVPEAMDQQVPVTETGPQAVALDAEATSPGEDGDPTAVMSADEEPVLPEELATPGETLAEGEPVEAGAVVNRVLPDEPIPLPPHSVPEPHPVPEPATDVAAAIAVEEGSDGVEPSDDTEAEAAEALDEPLPLVPESVVAVDDRPEPGDSDGVPTPLNDADTAPDDDIMPEPPLAPEVDDDAPAPEEDVSAGETEPEPPSDDAEEPPAVPVVPTVKPEPKP